VNDTQQIETQHLHVELRSSRESQAVMVNKVTQLESETLAVKQAYIQYIILGR
jgi:hypothetical protein